MAGRNDIANSGNDISDMDMKSLARTLFPIIRDYLLSEQGQKDYADFGTGTKGLCRMEKQTTEYKT